MHPSNLSAAASYRTNVWKFDWKPQPSGHVISVATGFYFISIHFINIQQKYNILQLLFSHFKTKTILRVLSNIFFLSITYHVDISEDMYCVVLLAWRKLSLSCLYIQKQFFWTRSQNHTPADDEELVRTYKAIL